MAASAYLLAFIALATLATFLTRALPFMLFRNRAEHPLLQFLGRYLPPVLIVLLLVYSLSEPLLTGRGVVQAATAMLLVLVLHRIWHNALVSILGGTLGYMLLVQIVLPLGV